MDDIYLDMKTGEEYSLDELKQLYEQFKDEMPDKDFDEYLDRALRDGLLMPLDSWYDCDGEDIELGFNPYLGCYDYDC